MRLRSILGEAARDVGSGTARAATLALLLALGCGLLAGIDALAVVQLEARAETYRGSAADTLALSAPGRIDARACDGLEGVGGIEAAGALRAADPVRARALPGRDLAAFTVSPALAGLVGAHGAETGGVWVSEELARMLDIRPGEELLSVDGPVRVAATFPWPDDGRDVRLRLAVLMPDAGAAPYDECWARAWPPTAADQDWLRTAASVDPAAAEPATVAQVNKVHGATFEGAALFAERPTRRAVDACALVGLLMGVAAVRRRRLEHAAALHVGQSRSALIAVALVEAAVWAVTGAGVCLVALLVVVGRAGVQDLDAVLTLAARGPTLGAAGALVGTALGALAVRERHLFRYFKNR
ncbi:hypothetical protein [Cellulomonas hominis]|uniref:hypothetical protein n=1 Tax=Cellulomonas hominis TaxID=156981 RepID=UPI001B9FDF5F|nr:hypothetical protein [Cellulomonas hominis]VTR75863.1 hypothetical protein CHMI_00616 [Cellulomonas hominis]